MSDLDYTRPDPDAILRMLQDDEKKSKKGKLKIFLGMCAGVGKTYAMLSEAREALASGVDVVIGYVETHNRMETAELVLGMPIIPRKRIEYRGTYLEEMDTDSIIARKPKVVLVDELAHTNAPGSRHARRYQDVMEILNNGIDVYTTLNVQHLESRADAVAQITGIMVRETVPDSIFESADEIKVIDISPDELLRRLEEGKVYTAERSKEAIRNFFRKGNLSALREMTLRLAAERVDRQILEYRKRHRILSSWKSGQRLIAAISASPHSVSVIRWAKRISYTIDASWVVVYVDQSDKLSEKERDQLTKNMKLARELGAEVVTTSGVDIADSLIRVAHEQNANLILVGRPNRFLFSRASRLIDNLIQRSSDLDIYIVGQEKESRRKLSTFLPKPHSSLFQYVGSIALILFTALICFLLQDYIDYRLVSFILLFVLILLPLKVGPGPTVVSAAVAALLWDFLFIPPRYTFLISTLEDTLFVILFFIVAVVTGVLSAGVRKRERIIRQREQRASALFALTKDLSSAHSEDEVVEAAIENIKKYFDADVVVFLADTEGEMKPSAHPASSFIPDSKEFSVAAWVYWNEKKAGRNTDTLPFAQATYYPMSGPRYPLGVIGVKLSEGRELSFDQEILLENFVSQITSAVERELLNELNRKSVVVAESERLYKTLFNSISHEFRTPIATIVGVSENLLSKQNEKTDRLSQESIKEIHQAAERLNRLVVNLLDMTRLESGMIQPRLDWCDIRDIINEALKNLQGELEGHNVSVEIDESVPLMRLDFGLIEQAFMNLIHNACIHTPPGTDITIRGFLEDGNICVISVADNGPGLPKENTNRIFEKFYRAQNGKTGGTGLGLTIARGFIEAHHGTITARNRTEGGAEFIVRLPIYNRPGQP